MKNEEMIGRVRQAMAFARVINADVARACTITEQAVGLWFKRGTISKASLEKVAELTGTSLHWLMTGEGSMKPAVNASAQYTVPPGEMTEAIETFLRLPRSAQHRVFAAILDEAEKAGIPQAPERPAGGKVTIVASGPEEFTYADGQHRHPDPGFTEASRKTSEEAEDEKPGQKD